MSEDSTIRTVVVDDHPIVRLGLATFLDAQPDMAVVGQAGSGEESVSVCREHQPDIVLMDLQLPGMSGSEAIRAIRAENSHCRFVVMTTYEGDEDIHQALEAGAQGYLIKCMPSDALADAVRRVHAGRRVLPAPVAESLAAWTPNSALTDRERDVLELIVEGRSNKEIGTALGITEGTVKCHVNVILGRLGVSGRTEAAVAALRRGIIRI